MKGLTTIDRALRDPALLGAALEPPESWRTWITTLKAAFGVSLDRQERRAFEAVAGGRATPKERVRELVCIHRPQIREVAHSGRYSRLRGHLR